ncbi:MAG: hypothetical protein K8R69_02595 [Deltaproteobacteria bacterium]|nr:hypothetical protein [Deltaproteobacteria bacterium]
MGFFVPSWKLRWGLRVLSLLGAFATSLSKISAQAYLIKNFPPQYLIIHLAGAGLSLWLITRIFSRYRSSYYLANLAFPLLAAMTYWKMQDLGKGDIVQANLLVFSALFFNEYFYFTMSETINRYIHPINVPTFIAGTFSAFEVGTIIALGLAGFSLAWIPVDRQLQISAWCGGAMLLWFGIWFLHPGIRPIKFQQSTRQVIPPASFSPQIKKMLRFVVVLGAFGGGIRILSEYSAAFMAGISIPDFHLVSQRLSLIYMTGSGVILFSHFGAILVEKKEHKAPTFWMGLASYSAIAALFLSFFLPIGATAFLVGAGVRGSYKGFFTFGLETCFSSFNEQLRNLLKRAFNLSFYFVRVLVVGIPVLGLWLSPHRVSTVLLSCMLFLALATLATTRKLNLAWNILVWKFMKHEDKTGQIKAASQLARMGFKKPLRVVKHFLRSKPKTVFLKTLIESLGKRSKQERHAVSETLIRYFYETDKEEIHTSILRTLARLETPWNIRFFQEIVLGADRTLRLRVRQVALSKLAHLYGNRAAAFCLDGLKSEDPKVVAETLVHLANFRNQGMETEFRSRARDSNPYVQSAALFALAKKRSTRNEGIKGLAKMLGSTDTLEIYLALEKIQLLGGVTNLLPAIEKIHQSKEGQISKIRLLLGSIFISAGKREGFEVFAETLFRISSGQRGMAGVHYFSILSPEDRMSVVYQVARLGRKEKWDLSKFERWLKESGYDFHWEIDAMRYMRWLQHLSARFSKLSSRRVTKLLDTRITLRDLSAYKS